MAQISRSSSTIQRSPASGLGHVFKSLARPFRISSVIVGSPRIQPTVIGGAYGNDINQLLEKLDESRNSVSDRIKAAELIRATIEDSSVSSIPEIWYAAKGMIAPSQQTECRRAGLRLMKTCIAHDERAVGSRILYYKTIIEHSNLEDFDLQLNALIELTNDGRDLLDLYLSGYPMPHVLSSWLRRLANETQDIRIGKKKDITLPWGVSMEENFLSILSYLNNTLKFSVAVFEESDLDNLLREIIGICRKTSQRRDIALCCDLIDSVMTYGNIPTSILHEVLEILCGIHITVDQQAEQSWQTVLNLVKSHVGNLTVLSLCRILEGGKVKEINSNTMRGAARFLKRLALLFIGPEKPETQVAVEIPVPQLFSALKASLAVESARHCFEVTSCILELLSNEKFRDSIDYEVWQLKSISPLDIMKKIIRLPVIEKRVKGTSTASIGPSAYTYYGAPEALPPTSSEDVILLILENMQNILKLLSELMESKSFTGPIEESIQFLLDMHSYIDENTAEILLNYLQTNHWCNPLAVDWSKYFYIVIHNFYVNSSSNWSSNVRVQALKLVREVYTLSQDAHEAEVIKTIDREIFSRIRCEQDSSVLEEALALFEHVALTCDVDLFTHTLGLVMDVFVNRDENESPHTVDGTSISNSATNEVENVAKTHIIAKSVAKLFVSTFRYLPQKARIIYFHLITICKVSSEGKDYLAFLESARILCRIRVSLANYVYLSAPNNMDSLAVSLGRAYEGEEILQQQNKKSDAAWWYPDNISYLKMEDLDSPSTTLKQLVNRDISDEQTEGDEQPEIVPLEHGEYEIDISMWLNIMVNIIEDGSSWEIYSFVLTHLVPQLSNIQLFNKIPGDIRRLRKVLCDQISSAGLPGIVVCPTDVNKLDILAAEIRILTLLVAYNDMFTKTDTDYMVQAFVRGLSSWEKTAIACIHGLVICCYECPASIKRFLGQIFTKFQTKITSTMSSPHILEFLLALSRLPSLIDNFTQDEYKRVFAMAFKYIQHANDLARKLESSSGQTTNVDSPEMKMSQYLLALAYRVIPTWFLILKVSNRKFIATYITRNLILANGDPKNIDEQSLAMLDLISRYSHSNLDLMTQMIPTSTIHPDAERWSSKRWLYGASILSIDTNIETGTSQFVMRRPTGTTVFNVEPDSLMLSKETFSNQYEHSFSPSYYLLQMVVPMDVNRTVKPLPIGEDAASSRAILSFDRTPVVDFYKVGVLYIAPGQITEQEILSNSSGSRQYRKFLDELGTLVKLQGNKRIYTGGLDTGSNVDGEYAYAWSDQTTQVIYHTATMMPVTGAHDTSHSSKKRHMGNSYVNIYFDESGLPFKFGVVRSQFNFLNIVISHHTASFSSRLLLQNGSSNSKKYYLIRVYQNKDVPEVFVACHVKIVSEESLPVFVRNLALMASKFATVWHSGGQYVSNWRYRLQQINQLYDRVRKQLKEADESKESNSSAGSDDKKDVGASFLEQLSSGNGDESKDLTNVGSVVKFVSEKEGDDLPLLQQLGFTSFT